MRQAIRTILAGALPLAAFDAASAQGPVGGVKVHFEDQEPGAAPKGWTPSLTGGGGEPEWRIVVDPTSSAGPRVLAQTSTDETNGRYPLCILDGWSAENVKVSVRFRPISGQVDRAGGLVVRYKDKDTYYVVRANALEDNVRLYHVTNGRRVQFAGLDHVLVKDDEWHTLALEAIGNRFRVWFNGSELFQAEDARITGPGRVGVWTKADSVTHFDDFEAREEKVSMSAAAAASKGALVLDFEREAIDKKPAGFQIVEAPEAPALEWFVTEDPARAAGAKVLTSKSTRPAGAASESRPAGGQGQGGGPGRRSSPLLVEGFSAEDFTFRFQFKADPFASPNEPGMRTGGAVLRYKDRDDHCVLRINPREDNVQLHRVRDGKRKQIGEIHHKRIAEGEWHAVEIRAEGPSIRVSCDGELLFEAVDRDPLTAGRVGLTGAADAKVFFDDLTLESRDR